MLAGLDFLSFSLAVLRSGDAIFKVGVLHGFVYHNGMLHFPCSPKKPWHLALHLCVAHHNVHTAAILFNSLLLYRHRAMLWDSCARLPASSCRYYWNPAPDSFRVLTGENTSYELWHQPRMSVWGDEHWNSFFTSCLECPLASLISPAATRTWGVF